MKRFVRKRAITFRRRIASVARVSKRNDQRAKRSEVGGGEGRGEERERGKGRTFCEEYADECNGCLSA